jgi:Holliday junction resolvase RusA-like endonuclease
MIKYRQRKKEMIIKIPLLCRSKKNGEQILKNRKTGKYFISQGERYKQFEKDCGYFLNKYKTNINYPVNLKCTFYVPDRIRRDLTNLENAIADILVKYEILEDDNYNIIAGWDGSRIIYEKGKEEIKIEITKM